MLFEFECGCVGFGKTVEDDCEVSMLVYACDSDDGNYGFLKRDMTGKTFEPLTFEKEKKVFSRISSLIKFVILLETLKLRFEQELFEVRPFL